MNAKACFFVYLALFVSIDGMAIAKEMQLSAGDLRKSGTVRLDIACRKEVKEDFQTALALLHSFFYEEARRRFESIAKRDPGCAMAWWGVAMTWYHPLWAPPTPEEMTKGIEAIERAKAIGGDNEFERGLIDTIDAFFRSEDEPVAPDTPAALSCHGPRAHSSRAEAFKASLEKLHQKFPDNLEVQVFYSLSLLGTASPKDKTYARQLQATAILEPLFEMNPDHPGIAHYIIHSYDYPSLAARALIAAHKYDDIAPWVPHALHMPTHIYTRLGMWQESIDGNLASSAAARDYAARVHDGATVMDDLHALDYLVFAYLQTAQDEKAFNVVNHLKTIQKLAPGNEFASAYALGAIPARYALERRQWKDASELPVPLPKFMDSYPYAVAHIEFARAVGAAQAGNPELSKQAIVNLDLLADRITEPKFQWWKGQIEIQKLAAQGWLRHAEGNDDEAVRFLQQSSELEDKAGTHPVTPGQILPAHEQLAGLFIELNRPAEALTEYQQSLKAFPNRFNSHFGAGKAAELSGKPEVAKEHYAQLVRMAALGEGRVRELSHAREFLAR